MPTEAVARLLLAYIRRRVRLRGGAVGDAAATAKTAVEIAAALTVPPPARFGLMLMGGVGTGKTTAVRAMQDTLNCLGRNGLLPRVSPLADGDGLRLVGAKDVQRDGDSERWFAKLRREPLLAIDDLGAEPTERLVFGNASTPVSDLLEHRYDRRLYTVATTNLTAADLRRKYGDRIADRCREMFTIIRFKGNSYRQ